MNIEAVQEIKTLADSLKTDLAKERKELAENLRNKTKSLFDSIAILKSQLIEEIGEGYDSKMQTIRKKRAVAEVESFMIGEGHGKQLEKALDNYIDELNQEYKSFLGSKIYKLTELRTIDEDDILKGNPDFIERYFENSSLIETVATLSLFQSEIIRYEQEILKKLGATDRLSENMCCLCGPVAVAAVQSSVLIHYDNFQVYLFLASSAFNIKPKITFNNEPVLIEDGIGKVNFLIPDTITKSQINPWQAMITYTHPYTRQTKSHLIEGKYYIDLPVSIQSTSALPLYEKCTNPIEVSSFYLLKHPTIDFEVSEGAELIKSTELGKFTLIPDGSQKYLTVKMLKNGKILDSIQFQVQEVPLPSLVLTDKQGNELDISKPITPQTEFQLKVIPDEAFYTLLPQEANYKIYAIDVLQIREGETKAIRRFSDTNKINMQQFNWKQGDVFQVIVLGIHRFSTQHKRVPVALKQNMLGFVINNE